MLRRISSVPPVVVAALVAVCVAAALIVGTRWSALLLLPVLALLAALSRHAWPRLSRGQRAMRLVVLGALVGWTASTLLTG